MGPRTLKLTKNFGACYLGSSSGTPRALAGMETDLQPTAVGPQLTAVGPQLTAAGAHLAAVGPN